MRNIILPPLCFLFSVLVLTTHAQVVSFTNATDVYQQNFDSLGASGSNLSLLPAGWWLSETGTRANAYYSAGDGSSTGDTYSYGTGSSSDRAFGTCSSRGGVTPTIGVRFVNNTGSSTSVFSYSLVMEQWSGGSRSAADDLLFSYRINSGSWNALPAHSLLSAVLNQPSGTALDGNLHQNRRYYNFTVTGITWNAGDTLTMRWMDDDKYVDDGLAIDNFKFTIRGTLPVLAGGPKGSTWDITSPQAYELASDVTFSSSPKVLIVRDGASLHASTYSVSCDSAYIYGTFTTTHASGLSGTFGSAVIVLGANSSIQYLATSGSQSITARTDYANLKMSGSSTKNFSNATYEISGDFEVTGSTPVYGTSTVMRFDGTTQTISCPSFNSVEFTNTGTKTLGVATQVINSVTLADNAVLASNGNLTLVSDASGTARVATIPATASITGNVTAQRYIPAVARRSRMISPNVANFTFADIKDDIFVTGAGGEANGFDASMPNQTTIYTYQESGSRGWKGISNINNTLDAGGGALVFVRGDRTLPAPQWYTAPYVPQNAVTMDFTGTLNQGTISPSLTYTNTGSPADDGWNLVGNPYASQINWNTVSKSNLSSFYYVYDPSTGSYVAESGDSYIASGQAFFVQATAASPAITFNESDKVANSSISYFKTSSLPLEVKMVRDSHNSDVAWLDFNSNAQKGYSPSEDAVKLPNAAINLGFYINNLTLLQYSAVPAVQQTDTFTLFAEAANGTYQLEFSNVSTSREIHVYLKDLFTNTILDLQVTSSYTFTISSDQASKGNRFLLIYTGPSGLPVSWLSFSGNRSNEDVLLKWSTASEKNNNGFTVEKAEQASNDWSSIGFVTGKGNSNSVNNYSFVDAGAFAQSNTVYYRIKQTDKSGKYTQTQVISVSKSPFAGRLVTHIYPNPVQTVMYIDLDNELANASIEIIDSRGQLAVTQAITGLNNLVELSSLSPGVYMLRMIQGGQVFHLSKFIKN